MHNVDGMTGFGKTEKMRMPGVEPGSQAWEACMIPLHYVRVWLGFFLICVGIKPTKLALVRDRKSVV